MNGWMIYRIAVDHILPVLLVYHKYDVTKISICFCSPSPTIICWSVFQTTLFCLYLSSVVVSNHFFQKFATLEYISILFCHYLFFATYIYLVFWILLIFWAKYSLPDVLLKDRIANEKLPAMTYYYDALFRDIIMKVWIFAKPRTDQPSYDITFSSIIQNDYENINVFLSDR